MFGKIKNFAIKKVIQSQMKNVPADQREMIMTMLEKDPATFEKIAKEKMDDLNTKDLVAASKIVAGTAKSMGIKVE